MKQAFSERFSDDLLDEAFDMARGGATRGMITTKLKQRGVAPDVAESVAKRALRKTTSLNRRRGMAKMTGGIMVAWAGFYLLSNFGDSARFGVVLVVFGLVGSGNGFMDMISGTDQKTELV